MEPKLKWRQEPRVDLSTGTNYTQTIIIHEDGTESNGGIQIPLTLDEFILTGVGAYLMFAAPFIMYKVLEIFGWTGL